MSILTVLAILDYRYADCVIKNVFIQHLIKTQAPNLKVDQPDTEIMKLIFLLFLQIFG